MVRLVFDAHRIRFNDSDDCLIMTRGDAETTKAFFFEWCPHLQDFLDDKNVVGTIPLAIWAVGPVYLGSHVGFYSQVFDWIC